MNHQMSPKERAFTLMAVLGLLVIPLGLGVGPLDIRGQLAFLLYIYLPCLPLESPDAYLTWKTLHLVGSYFGLPRGPRAQRDHGFYSVWFRMPPSGGAY